MIIDTLGGQSPDLRKTQETQGDPGTVTYYGAMSRRDMTSWSVWSRR